MKTNTREYCKKYAFLCALFGAALSLTGCIVALPPAVQAASLALDGVSYLTTGKSVTDHAISGITAQDCAMMRALQGDAICTDVRDTEMALATGAQSNAEQGPRADEAADGIVSAAEDGTFQTFHGNLAQPGGDDPDEVLNSTKMMDLEFIMATTTPQPTL